MPAPAARPRRCAAGSAAGPVGAAGLAAAGLLAAGLTIAAERGGDIRFEARGGPGPVVFRHTTHDTAELRCTTCHTRLFPFRRATEITHAAMREGRQCGACHDGRRAFGTEAEGDCRRCHGG